MPLFPELRERLKRFLPDSGEPITLDLKYAGGVSFDAVSAGWYLRQGYPQIYALLTGGMPAWANESVSVETALNHSAVWACNRVISESIGYLPALLMQESADGKSKQVARQHPMYEAMLNQPNDEISAQGFSEMLTSHCLLEGDAFAQIIRRSGTGVAIGLQALLPQMVHVDREKGGQRRLVYVVKDGGNTSTTYTVTPGKPQDILHIRGLGWNGLRGYSVITMGRQSIGTAIAGERNVARFWANGGRVPYLLKHPQKFKTDQEFQRFRDDWEKVYAEPHRAPILEGGLDYEKIGLSMADQQLLESRQFTVSEICRWFSISPTLVADLSRATFSNIEELARQFCTFTLATWISRWEQEFRRCVLTSEERAQGYFLRHDLTALLRGDFQARMAGYATALQNGYMNQDEVRALEGMNPLPDGAGQDYHIQLNMQALPAGSAAPSGSGALVRLGKKE